MGPAVSQHHVVPEEEVTAVPFNRTRGTEVPSSPPASSSSTISTRSNPPRLDAWKATKDRPVTLLIAVVVDVLGIYVHIRAYMCACVLCRW